LAFGGPLVGDGHTIHQLGQSLARALARPEVRVWVKDQVDRSPYVENRIRFRQALMQPNRAAAVAQIADPVEKTMGRGLVASTRELELYFPVKAHLQTWRGGLPVQVAVPVNRSGDYVIYSTDGSSRRARGDRVPATPTLVLGPSEVDYDDLESALRGGSHTGDMMAAEPASFGPRPSFSISTAQHTRITYFRTSENHDDVFGGSDEVEMFGGMNGPGWSASTPNRGCKRFTNITKNTNYNFPNDAARTIATAIPTGLPDKVRVDAWEDDNEGCVLHTGDDDFYGFISLASTQYNSVQATIRDSGAPGHISIKVEAGTP
jgi:hypothetical protein